MNSFYSKEFKDAISNLSSKEKDKLIFRLLKKDLNLANRLMFELVSLDSVESRREKVKSSMQHDIERSGTHFYSTGYLNMDVRELSGKINEHVGITKDKYGEISLNLWMINEVLGRNQDNILSESYRKASKFCIAVIARAFKIIILIKKQHEDYFIDFEDDLQKLGKLISENRYLMECAIYNGFDVNWLLLSKIPDNIEQIHKDIRERGYLR